MRRSTTGILLLIGIAAAGILYGLYWFYRVPVALSVENAQRDVFRKEDLVSGGTPDGGIPSIDAPIFESVGAADQYLKDEGLGLDVEVGGKSRFYPFQILVWHEVVNDTFGDNPLVVTFSPLTMTGMVFERPDATTVFHVSGALWNNNLVLFDEGTHSLWSQILGKAVEGVEGVKGTALVAYPSTVSTWTDWKVENPLGEVLSRDSSTNANRDYTRDPYGSYYSNPSILFPLTFVDARLPAKKLVCVASDLSSEALAKGDDGKRTAYPLEYRQRPEDCVQGFWFAFAAAFPEIEIFQLP